MYTARPPTRTIPARCPLASTPGQRPQRQQHPVFAAPTRTPGCAGQAGLEWARHKLFRLAMARHTRAGVHRNNAVCTSSQPFLNVVEMFRNTLSYSQPKGVSRVCGRRGSRSPAKASRPRLPLPGARRCARPHIRTLTTRNHWHACIPSTFLSHTEVSGEPHSLTRSCSPPPSPHPPQHFQGPPAGLAPPRAATAGARGPAGEDVLPRAAPRILTKPNTCGRRAPGRGRLLEAARWRLFGIFS